jgi:hypothetical protein
MPMFHRCGYFPDFLFFYDFLDYLDSLVFLDFLGSLDSETPIIRPWNQRATHSLTTSAAARGTGEAEVRGIGNGRGGGNIKGRVALFNFLLAN